MSTQPFVSVVMPVRNEGSFIVRSLGSVLAQDYPRELMEILVSDGMSDDGTRQAIADMARVDSRVRMLDNPGRFVARGLNEALRDARGTIIVRVDGHCEIAPDYVRRCVGYLQRADIEGVGGPLDTIGETYWARVIAAAMSSPFGVGDSAFRVTKARTELVDTVAFPAYTRAAIDRAGPFDEELVRNQDDEYNYRLRKLGARILLAADVRAKYYSRSSIGSLWRQYYQYGYWKVRVMQKHPWQMRPRQFVPVAFVSVLAGSVLLSPVSRVAGAMALLTAGAYAAANLTAAIVVGRRLSLRSIPALAATFAALHTSYGCGFAVGLVKFRHRWSGRELARGPVSVS